ncbi:MAG: prepilin-type N-terminal cleavage/methylation domain-containing protein [Thiothrix sp.]|nr:MAG: prepilin-type N-terminal cleavage/methylation domain-containing protein [Thiothrix sp.]
MKRIQQNGMTLIELMVTLAVVAILATVAAPSLQSMIERNQLQTLTNGMVANLYLARSEAAKRGFNVVLCASNVGQTTCDSTATSFANGWIIFTDYDKNGSLTAETTKFDTNGDGLLDSPEEILAIAEATNPRFTVVSNGNPANLVSYRPTGDTSPRTFSIRIANAKNDKALSKIYFNTTGRVRSCTITSGEDC